MRLLANPVFIRMAAVFLVGAAAFLVGVLAIRTLRRRIVDDGVLSDPLGEESTLYPYTAVIQQLKQQKFELQNEQQLQRRRAKAYESVATTVIANLPCGVLFVAPNGLVKQSNAAARQILGFASPVGMDVNSLFRDAKGVPESGLQVGIAAAFKSALRERSRSSIEATYRTAAGEERALRVTLIPLNAVPGEASGLAAVLTDESADADSRRARIVHTETSAEMALDLRSSLAIIRECAKQMAAAPDREFAASVSQDICAETERLEKVVGGFLAGVSAASPAGA